MIISVWRYSHLSLAVSSFLLLILASVSGIILAFEPVVQKAKPYKVDGFDQITLAQSLPVLKEKLDGLQEIKVDENGFVIAKFSDEEGKDKTAYIHPLTGAVLGTPGKQAPIFEWMTALHRSLFLHETGRFIVGIGAFLLVLIAISGFALIVKRQNGIRNFFANIEKTSFAQYYHTVFGRISLIFILALALTGTCLSVSRFVLKPQKAKAIVNEKDLTEDAQVNWSDFKVFRDTRLAEVDRVVLPFSDFPEDYFTLALKEGEQCVNQFSGKIIASENNTFAYSITAFSMQWHTGRSSAVWAIIMAITSAYILFFIYSGFIITWKRIGNRSKNKYTAKESVVIILVGSENGSTNKFANSIHKQLLRKGIKVHTADMDTYTQYPQATHLIIMASTYGEGDPPSNARKFLSLLNEHPQLQSIQFSVLGFGSRNYNHFCKFAYDVQHSMEQQTWAIATTPVFTVNEKSPQDFSVWLDAYAKQTGFQLSMAKELLPHHNPDLQSFTVLNKTDIQEGIFNIQLKGRKKVHIASGDLLAVYPKNDHRERLYSIGKLNGTVQLSVKHIDKGLGSSYLFGLDTAQEIKARVIRNKHFHFPLHARQVLMVCNGTGIAPFLGMLSENTKKVSCTLYAGFRTQAAFALYENFLEEQVQQQRLQHLKLALSREGEKQYVTHLLQKDTALVIDCLRNGGVIMICGSLAMQQDVLAMIEYLCSPKLGRSVEDLLATGTIVTDCY
ncbi:MAG TPA: PepSY domain-containing protein [Phnomibacter sp.]|nr:PepSY domain-containing protein [Phnomibacter sp.]